jgi:hypothetical protein
MELMDAARNIGAEVVYRPHEGTGAEENGVITSVSEAGWVFVRYGTDAISKATYPTQLYLVGEQS